MKNSKLQPTTKHLTFVFLLSLVSLTNNSFAQTDVSVFFHDATKILNISFTANSKLLIAKSGEEVVVGNKGVITSPCIQFWDLDTKRKSSTIAGREISRASCFSGDGNYFAYREASLIYVMDLNTKKTLNQIKFADNKFARPIGFTSDNKSLIVEQGNKSFIYDIATATVEREFLSNGLSHYISRDDSYMVDAFVDSFRLYEFKTGKELNTFFCGQGGRSEELKAFLFSPENRFAATLSDGKVKLWDMMTFKLAHTMSVGPKDMIFAFSNDGRYIVGGVDTLKLWEIKTRKEILTPLSFDSKITAASFSVDGKFLAAGDSKGIIKMWDFNEENVAGEYFSREIAAEVKQIRSQGEFEKSDEYQRRFNKGVRSIRNKYLGQYGERTTSEKTIQEVAQENIDHELEEKKARIRASRTTINFRIDSVSAYNPDKETFVIHVVNEQERYDKTETIRVPRRDNAAANFKKGYATAVVQGTKQLKDDERTYELYNVRIKLTIEGKEYIYNFGQQRQYIEEQQ
jgi:WD40 repeat protein